MIFLLYYHFQATVNSQRFSALFHTRWKTRGRGPGVRGPRVRGPGVWKTWGLVENVGSGGKRGVWWKTRGLVENVGSGGKRGVWWKTWGLVEKAGSKCKTRGNTIFR